ncbi:MAG: hypothetical protein HJJLKODD_01992 [Phycisphaerae bacterium]|nr:hypothetical protein [Phycisphaerae bacterium]
MTGCWQPQPPTSQELQRGMVWMMPGVSGWVPEIYPAYRAFRDAGVDRAIRVNDRWFRAWGMFRNLQEIERNRALAAEFAAEIIEYRKNHPHQPIDLVGYSGGGAMVLFIAEALPEDIHLRNIVLCQAAISPDYDLQPALRRVTGHIVNFHCPSDGFMLGWGTRQFGTMDRKFVESAGRNGFNIEQAIADSRQRDRLRQVAWNRDMFWTGHWGTHLSMLAYGWNRRYIAPCLAIDDSAIPLTAEEAHVASPDAQRSDRPAAGSRGAGGGDSMGRFVRHR